MAIAIRSQSSPTLAASGTSIVINMPAGIQAGDYLIAFIQHQTSASTADLTSSGWTRIGASFIANDSASRVTGMYARVATGSETSTYTFAGVTTSGRAAGFAVAFTGVDTTTPVAYSSAWYKAATSSGTLSVSAEASTANLYTLEIWASNFASSNSYALTNYDGGLTFIGDGYSPSGTENTGVSRTALRVWGSVAPVGGVPAHTIVTSGTNTQRCAYLVSLNAATGSVRTPPTMVATYSTPYNTAGYSKFLNITTQPGDVIVVWASISDQSSIYDTITGNSLTYTLQHSFDAAANATISSLWTATDTTGGTAWPLTVTHTLNDSSIWGMTVMVFRGSDGIGGMNWTVGTSAPNKVQLTTNVASSAVAFFISDSSYPDGSVRTWGTVNGITPSAANNREVLYYQYAPGWFTTLGGYYDDAGAAGVHDYGIESPTSGHIQVRIAVEILGAAPAADPIGLPLKVSNGSTLDTAYFRLADGAGGLVTPGAYKVLRPGYSSVTQMLAQTTFYCAHRGGSLDYPEMSMYAYGQAALLGYPAFELSLARTSDGVWFGLHDSTLDRTSGVSGVTASSLTWAQVQTYNILGSVASNNPGQPNRPYMRWEEIIALYYPSHVIFVDPKVALTYHSELLTMMNSLPGTPTDHFVAKYFGEGNSGGWPANARTAGYKTWGYYYAGGAWATWQHLFDILGMDYSAPSGDWTSILSHGKPVMGHIAPNSAAVTTALSKGAAGVMVSGVKVNIPPAIT